LRRKVADLGSFHTPTRWASTSDHRINGNLHISNDIDRPLNEVVVDKIRAYLTDCNNRHSNDISFMSTISSTSGRLHSEFVYRLCLQVHQVTDLFFAVSGVQLPQPTTGLFHFHGV
jgi:hypothetical protein